MENIRDWNISRQFMGGVNKFQRIITEKEVRDYVVAENIEKAFGFSQEKPTTNN